MRTFHRWLGLLVSCSPSVSLAAEQIDQTQQTVQNTGVSAIWILANISYAGMRAQNSPSSVWRVVSFIFGFPGTLISYFAVPEGKERAYGIDIPKKSQNG